MRKKKKKMKNRQICILGVQCVAKKKIKKKDGDKVFFAFTSSL
jgi:hypothetical protein